MNGTVKKYKLSELNEHVEHYDLFICSASFENRCLSVSRNVDVTKFQNAFIFFMQDFIDHVNTNKKALEGIWESKAICIEMKHSDPLITADNILNALTELAKKVEASVLVDTTTFTHESLLILIRILGAKFPQVKVSYAYTNASVYDSDNEKDNKWLSKGIGEIRSVLGYPGDILPARKTYLMVIVGYEYERAASIINSLEPSSLALGFGRADNATTEKDKSANEHYLNLVKQMTSSNQNIDCFEVKCNDPFETRRIIKEKADAQSGMNIVVVPLNNKISTLGVALAAIGNEKIQLCYAPASVYNYSNYSNPGDHCYLIDMADYCQYNVAKGGCKNENH